MATALNVWMNGQLVGEWSNTRNRVSVFKYDSGWLRSRQSRPLSLSMPMTAGNGEHRGAVVENYFDNLLPDNEEIRKRLRTRYATKSTNAFELLTAIGRDCVGAVQLLPPNTTPEGWNSVLSEPMDEAAVAQALRDVSTAVPLGQKHGTDRDFRISIAGAQEKTALLRFGEGWHRPLGATPTTHIIKLPLGLVGNMRADLWDSVENEWLCATILRQLGLDIAVTHMAQFEDQKALVIERFDRRWQGVNWGAEKEPGFVPTPGVWIARLPQEDFCQITAKPPGSKYEADGGPGIRQCLDQLAGSNNANHDRAEFVMAQLAFWLLAATDGHAKNFSVALLRGGGFSMTPLYDVLSAWPIIGKGTNKLAYQDAKLAMAMPAKSKHYKLADIRVRHWKDLAATCGPGVWTQMVEMVRNVVPMLDNLPNVLPKGFPTETSDKIFKGMAQHAGQFLREMETMERHA